MKYRIEKRVISDYSLEVEAESEDEAEEMANQTADAHWTDEGGEYSLEVWELT